MPTSADRNEEFEDGFPPETAEDIARRETVRVAGPCDKRYGRAVNVGPYELRSTEFDGMNTLNVAEPTKHPVPVPFGCGPHSPPLIDVTKPATGSILAGPIECGHITSGMIEEVRKQFADGKFQNQTYVGTPKTPAGAVTIEDTTQYVKRDSFIMEFFAYETIGATIPHACSMIQTDDPALMQAIAEAEAQGRVVIDAHGGLTFVDPDPDKDDDPDDTPLIGDDDDVKPSIVIEGDASAGNKP